jgi:hypothetical protein
MAESIPPEETMPMNRLPVAIYYLKWCCYKTVDFATAASQNGVFLKCNKIFYSFNISL